MTYMYDAQCLGAATKNPLDWFGGPSVDKVANGLTWVKPNLEWCESEI